MLSLGHGEKPGPVVLGRKGRVRDTQAQDRRRLRADVQPEAPQTEEDQI